MNTDDFIHPVVVLILKVKKLAQPKCRLIRKSTPLPQIGYPIYIISVHCGYQPHTRTGAQNLHSSTNCPYTRNMYRRFMYTYDL